MNIAILLANILTFFAFLLHAFMGDKEIKFIEPEKENDEGCQKREKWTMVRCGWHWISFDLLFTTIGLAIINFTDLLENEALLLQILAIYFFCYGLVWLITVAMSRKFPKNFLKLGQWILLWLISGLIYFGVN